ncbi:hypothetical protein AC579_2932 [Pseudocercospora musae]|uniref:Uncharacterized protein n=1 Tax=Pseudocercospora musae TaxID=113226 RepID=A0A139IUG1_9PEZI|nr:hypothetical protein AC579_2932 [Pseudocercospora musae]
MPLGSTNLAPVAPTPSDIVNLQGSKLMILSASETNSSRKCRLKSREQSLARAQLLRLQHIVQQHIVQQHLYNNRLYNNSFRRSVGVLTSRIRLLSAILALLLLLYLASLLPMLRRTVAEF